MLISHCRIDHHTNSKCLDFSDQAIALCFEIATAIARNWLGHSRSSMRSAKSDLAAASAPEPTCSAEDCTIDTTIPRREMGGAGEIQMAQCFGSGRSPAWSRRCRQMQLRDRPVHSISKELEIW